jgi:hypothetical protein
MPLYQGMKLLLEETHVPKLIDHLHAITLEHNYNTQVEASFRRLRILHEQASRFFLDKICTIQLDNDQARKEWQDFARVSKRAIEEGGEAFKTIKIRIEESLRQRCQSFEVKLSELDGQAIKGLDAVFFSWQAINWRTLHAALKRKGMWFSVSLQREINLNEDIARAYLDLVPFIWDDFFGLQLAGLTDEVVKGSHEQLHKTAERLKGAMDMLRSQPAGIRESMEASLHTAADSFQLQSGQVRTAISAQIQRTRQALRTGIVEAAATFMQPAYDEAGKDPGGAGMKQRTLNIIVCHAKQHAPKLFINIRQELAEGVDVLESSIKPQLFNIVSYGTGVLERLKQNTASHQFITSGLENEYRTAWNQLTQPANIT